MKGKELRLDDETPYEWGKLKRNGGVPSAIDSLIDVPPGDVHA